MDDQRVRAEVIALGLVSAEQADAIAAAPSRWQTFAQRLVENGCNKTDVLAAVSAATGLPPAPRTFVNPPTSVATPGISPSTWQKLPAAPVQSREGQLHVLVPSLAAATQLGAMGVPARAYAALEEDIYAALNNPAEAALDIVQEAMGQVDLATGGAPDRLDLPGDEDMSVPLASPHEHVAEMMGQAPTDPLELADDPGAALDVVHDTQSMLSYGNTTPAGLDDASGGGAAALPSLELGEQSAGHDMICGYAVAEKLGEGASAIVYRATKPDDGTPVALKIITKEASREPGFTGRFKREIRSHASLTHPNIVQVLDYGREDGWYYLATEYLPLGDLEAVLSHGAVPPPIAVCILDDMLQGVAFAHERGVVHRDLKPGNMLLSEDGHVKIGDFGLAHSDTDPNKSTAGAVRGTPAYMSPEQAMGKPSDGRSDLFTLASIIYELLTGTNPYRRDSGPAALMAVAAGKAPPLMLAAPHVPPVLDDAVYGMGRRDADDRFAHATAALAPIGPYLAEVTQRWPGLVGQYFEQPAATRRTLIDALVQDHLVAARAAAEQGAAGLPRAAFEVQRALSLAPENPTAQKSWAQIAQAGGFSAGAAASNNLIDAEAHALEHLDDPRALKRAAEAARGEKHVVKWAAFLRAYVRHQRDSHAEHQLQMLLGEQAEPAAASASPPAGAPETGGPFAQAPTTHGGGQTAPAPQPAERPVTAPAPAPPAREQSDPRRKVQVAGSVAEPASGGGATAPLVVGGLVVVAIVLGAAFFFLREPSDAPPDGPPHVYPTDVPKDPSPAPKPEVNPIAARQGKRIADAKGMMSSGKHDSAIAFLTMAIDDDPSSPLADEARLLRAEAHLELGNRGTGVSQLERILRIAPAGSDTHKRAQTRLEQLGATNEDDAAPK